MEQFSEKFTWKIFSHGKKFDGCLKGKNYHFIENSHSASFAMTAKEEMVAKNIVVKEVDSGTVEKSDSEWLCGKSES